MSDWGPSPSAIHRCAIHRRCAIRRRCNLPKKNIFKRAIYQLAGMADDCRWTFAKKTSARETSTDDCLWTFAGDDVMEMSVLAPLHPPTSLSYTPNGYLRLTD